MIIKKKHGFTMVELMIASIVFGMIMMITMSSYIYLSKLYQRVVTSQKTQETIGKISDDISRKIKYSKVSAIKTGDCGGYKFKVGAMTPDCDKYYCIDGALYLAKIGFKMTNTQPILQRATSCEVPAYQSSLVNLLPKNYYLIDFNITPAPVGDTLSSYAINVLYEPDSVSTKLTYLRDNGFIEETSGPLGTVYTCKPGNEYCKTYAISGKVSSRLN